MCSSVDISKKENYIDSFDSYFLNAILNNCSLSCAGKTFVIARCLFSIDRLS